MRTGSRWPAPQHAETIDFDAEDPTAVIEELTGGVGVDAQQPAGQRNEEFDRERSQVAPETKVQGDNWVPGDAPSQVSQWAVQALAKAGTLGIIGVYTQTMTSFPIDDAMMKNLTVKAGNCHHRHYLPELVALVGNGTVDPALLLTGQEPVPGCSCPVRRAVAEGQYASASLPDCNLARWIRSR